MTQRGDAFVQRLVQIANAHVFDDRMADTERLRQLIEAHEVVFGVWQDADKPNGVDVLLVKGDAFGDMEAIMDEMDTARVRLTAVRCCEAEEAHAMRKVFGDTAKQLRSQ